MGVAFELLVGVLCPQEDKIMAQQTKQAIIILFIRFMMYALASAIRLDGILNSNGFILFCDGRVYFRGRST